MVFTQAVGCSSSSGQLGSWNDSVARNQIVDFVSRVATPGSAAFVPEAERIAVFDNDGCLWAEQPAYFQLLFAMDRVRAMAPSHPERRTEQPYQAVLENDMKALAEGGERALAQLIMASHAGMTSDEFRATAEQWLATARHPSTGRLYTEMVYQPMLELLDYLRDNGFKTYIVSGGGIEFVRAFSEEVYGIPPEQVVGSSLVTEFEIVDGEPVLRRKPEIEFIDDKVGKPVGILSHIGRRPIAAFGNSDGDLQMLQWTAAGDGARFCMLVHHTDAVREFAYDRDSHFGRLDAALDEANARGWTVVDMQNDWKRVFTDLAEN